jgi:RNA polymerase sigma-70 factor (ECF subfamily)
VGANPLPAPQRAFEEVVSANLDALYCTALRFCEGRKADAEDLLQEAMLHALRRFGELRDPEAARSWLFTILVRSNLNRLRSRRRRGETLSSDLDEAEFEAALEAWRPSPSADEALDRIEVRDHLTRCLDRLDESLRQIIWLADVEGFRQTELAKMLDLPEGTIASRLFRARRELRKSIQDGAIEPSERKA